MQLSKFPLLRTEIRARFHNDFCQAAHIVIALINASGCSIVSAKAIRTCCTDDAGTAFIIQKFFWNLLTWEHYLVCLLSFVLPNRQRLKKLTRVYAAIYFIRPHGLISITVAKCFILLQANIINAHIQHGARLNFGVRKVK